MTIWKRGIQHKCYCRQTPGYLYSSGILSADETAVDGVSSSNTQVESKLTVSSGAPSLYSCCASVANVQPTFALNPSGRSDLGLLLWVECRRLRRSVEGSTGFSWFDFVGQKQGFAFHCRKIKTPWIPMSVVKITRKATSRPLDRRLPLLVLRVNSTHATAKMMARPTARRRARRLVRDSGCLRLTITM